jgi:hypothetical protein
MKNEEAENSTTNLSWGSVIAGAVAALGFQIMFTLLGAGLGLALVNPAQGDTPGKALGGGAVAWWFVTGLLALWIGGYVAGRLSASGSRMILALHGLVTWSFAAVLTLILVGSAAGAVIGGSFELVKNDLRGGGRGVSRMAAMARDKAEGMMNQDQSQDRQAAGDDAPLSAEAREKAEKAAGLAAGASLLAFFALILGATASTIGGLLSHSYWRERRRGQAAHR